MSRDGHDPIGQRPIAGTGAGELLEALVRQSCLSVVVPMALDVVERAPLASGGRFPGDLLRGLMEVPGGFWTRHPRSYERYRTALRVGAAMRRRLPRDQRMSFWGSLDSLAPREEQGDASPDASGDAAPEPVRRHASLS